jgi:hypothetical protein
MRRRLLSTWCQSSSQNTTLRLAPTISASMYPIAVGFSTSTFFTSAPFGWGLRRPPTAVENDLRPVCLHLSRGLAHEFGIELIAHDRAFGLIDWHRLTAIGETSGLSQKNILQAALRHTQRHLPPKHASLPTNPASRTGESSLEMNNAKKLFMGKTRGRHPGAICQDFE